MLNNGGIKIKKNQSQAEFAQVGDIGGGWWNGLYLDYFLLLTFGGIPWQVGRMITMIWMVKMILIVMMIMMVVMIMMNLMILMIMVRGARYIDKPYLLSIYRHYL